MFWDQSSELVGELLGGRPAMALDRASKWIPSAFQVVAAGIGALIAGPLGGAIGGFLGGALGDAMGGTLSTTAASATKRFAEKFGEEAGKKLYDIGVDAASEKLKPDSPNLAALYQKAFRLSLAEIQPKVSTFEDWFVHWNICLSSSDPPQLDEFRSDQLDAPKLEGFLRRTMETLDGIGAAYQQKNQSLRLQTRPMPDSLFDRLTELLPTAFKEHFQQMIVDPSNQQAWNEAQLIFQHWLGDTLGEIARRTETTDANVRVILDLLEHTDLLERYRQSVQLEAPHEVPSPVGDFTDRVADLQELLEACALSRTILVYGESGVGKTELGRRLVAKIRNDFPHGQVYFDLKGMSAAPVPSNELLSYLIQKFSASVQGADPGTADVEMLGRRYCSVMSGKRVLFFLDNVANSEQVGRIVPPEGCLLLITAHKQLDPPDSDDMSALRGMRAKQLPVFTQSDSKEFLLKMLPGIDQHAGEIASLCGGLPFALRRAARAISTKPERDPGEYARELSSNLKARNDLAESVIATSYNLLSPPELKQQWCSLSCFADPFSRQSMEAIWGLNRDAAERVVVSLIQSSLLHYDQALKCYYLHDLDRAFAQVNLENPQVHLGRHAAYFLRELPVRRHPLELLDAIANDVFAAYAFCEQERMRRGIGSEIEMVREILNAEKNTAEISLADAAQYVYLIARVFKRKQRFPQALALYKKCCDVARHVRSASLEGASLRSMGEIHWILGNQRDADDYCEKAIQRLSSEQDHASRKECIFTLHLNSERYLKDGLLTEAEEAARASLRVRDQIPPTDREMDAGLSNGAIKLTAFLLQRNDLEAANKLLTLERKNLEGISLASTLGQMGCAMSDAGHYAEADALLRDALRAYEPNVVGKGWIHRCLAGLELQRGNIEDARAHVEEALGICLARSVREYEAYQVALTFIVAERYYYGANKTEQVGRIAPQLVELYKQIERSEPSSKRKVAFAIAALEQTLSSCGHEKEAGEARVQRTRLEELIHGEEGSSSEVELLADRWGCDALALAWPGQLLRLLSPRRPAHANVKVVN